MNLEIRQATKSDLLDVLALYVQCLGDDSVLPQEEAERLLGKIERYPDYHVYVARADGETVGTFALLVMDNLAHVGQPSAVVEDVAVAPAWQGKGIGKRMMVFAMRHAREAGCYKMTLSSRLDRTGAHAFWESLGFRRHGYSFVVGIAAEGEAQT
jgi:GNAT superfamily N-acetyltransferase